MLDLIINEHREALAFVAVEMKLAKDMDAARLKVQDFDFRCGLLDRSPLGRALYTQVRGFDPREVRSAPSVRWLG